MGLILLCDLTCESFECPYFLRADASHPKDSNATTEDFSSWESNAVWWHSFGMTLFNKLMYQNKCASCFIKSMCLRSKIRIKQLPLALTRGLSLSLSVFQAFLYHSEKGEPLLLQIHSCVLCEAILVYLIIMAHG